MVESKLITSNQKGQGMIEYLLLLVITISMILLAMANLFRPMQKFMKDFMGTYVSCLLSSGELPGIRTTNALKDSEPKCNFSFAGGNATFPGGSGGTGTGGTTDHNGTDPNKNNTSGSNGKNKDGKDGKGTGGGSGNGSDSDGKNGKGGNGSYAGSRSRRSAFGSGSSSRRSSDSGGSDSDMAGGNGKHYVNNLDKNGNDKYFKTQQRNRYSSDRNGRGIAISGLTEEDQKKIERKIQSTARSVPKNNEEFSVPGKKSVLKPPPPKQKILTEEKEEGIGIGGFLKYIIIAIILLLILILGGGQAFEMSKSME